MGYGKYTKRGFKMKFYPVVDLQVLLGEKQGVFVTVDKKREMEIDINKMEKGKDYEIIDGVYSIYSLKGFFYPVNKVK